MASMTFALPDGIKSQMKELSWVNWSELAREELSKMLAFEEKIRQISEIADDDKREVREDVVRELVEKVERRISSGKLKSKNIKDWLKEHKL